MKHPLRPPPVWKNILCDVERKKYADDKTEHLFPQTIWGTGARTGWMSSMTSLCGISTTMICAAPGIQENKCPICLGLAQSFWLTK